MEFASENELLDSDIDGIFNFGIRLHAEKQSADICAIHFFGSDINEFLGLVPLLYVGYRF